MFFHFSLAPSAWECLISPSSSRPLLYDANKISPSFMLALTRSHLSRAFVGVALSYTCSNLPAILCYLYVRKGCLLSSGNAWKLQQDRIVPSQMRLYWLRVLKVSKHWEPSKFKAREVCQYVDLPTNANNSNLANVTSRRWWHQVKLEETLAKLKYVVLKEKVQWRTDWNWRKMKEREKNQPGGTVSKLHGKRGGK